MEQKIIAYWANPIEIIFSGTAYTRRLVGYIQLTGATGCGDIIPYAFSGTGSLEEITGVMVPSNSLGITASGKIITVPSGKLGNWGYITVLIDRNNAQGITITARTVQ